LHLLAATMHLLASTCTFHFSFASRFSCMHVDFYLQSIFHPLACMVKLLAQYAIGDLGFEF
jgi:hypothetical protein